MFKQTRKKSNDHLYHFFSFTFIFIYYCPLFLYYERIDKEQLNELEKFTNGEMHELIEHISKLDEHEERRRIKRPSRK